MYMGSKRGGREGGRAIIANSRIRRQGKTKEEVTLGLLVLYMGAKNYRLLVSSTKQLAFYVNQGEHHRALVFFSQMFASPDLYVDPFVLPLALKSAATLRDPSTVLTIHAQAIKSGVLSSPYVASSLVDSYGKSVSIEEAWNLFDECPRRNAITWNAMISLYSRCGDVRSALWLLEFMDARPTASSYNAIIAALAEHDDGSARAIRLYRKMQVSGVKPNLITLLALFPTCINLGALNFVKEIHGFAVRNHIHQNSHFGSGLLEAYGRCSSLVNARRVFDGLEERDVVAWSSMVSAYAFHGCAGVAMSLFEEMAKDDLRPDDIMFLGVLKACSHAGLADDAFKYFVVMTTVYNVRASGDHYSCLVDVLSRAGKLFEAYEVIQGMPTEATAKAWGALLGACRNFGEVRLAETAGRVLFEIEPDNAGNFALLANIYASAGMFEEAEEVWKEMEERQMRRTTGASWVVSKNLVCVASGKEIEK